MHRYWGFFVFESRVHNCMYMGSSFFSQKPRQKLSIYIPSVRRSSHNRTFKDEDAGKKEIAHAITRAEEGECRGASEKEMF